MLSSVIAKLEKSGFQGQELKFPILFFNILPSIFTTPCLPINITFIMSGFKSQIIIINIRQVILLEHYLVHIDVNGVFT